MLPYRVKVFRSQPRDRSIYNGLVGLIETRIITESYLHVGQGRGKPLIIVDEALIKMIQERISIEKLSKYVGVEPTVLPFSRTSGRPTIPGGTVKGNIRSRLELNFKAKNGVVRCCFIKASPAIKEIGPRGKHGWRHQRIWIPAVYEERGPPCNLTSDNAVCLLCDLFGTAGLKSLIDFSDFLLLDQNMGDLEIIDLPYNMRLEAVKPNSSFRGYIQFRNLKPEELGLLFIGMGIRKSSLSEQVLLGRLKYHKSLDDKKFGRIRYKVEELKFSKFSAPLIIDDEGISQISPGETLQGNALDKVIQSMIRMTLKCFDNELELIDEVNAVERIQ